MPKQGVEADLAKQRELKKQLEQEAKDKAEQKKIDTEAKKKAAEALKIQKAEAKLEKLKADAANRESKKTKKPVKRQLEKELEQVSEQHKSAPSDPSKSGPSSPAKMEQRGKALKLSPKAKKFAVNISPNTKHQKRVDARATRAASNLERLRGLKLDGLSFPPESFAKKILAYA